MESPQECVDLLKKYKKRIYATALESTVYYFSSDLKENVAIVIGNEGNGISNELLELADVKITIPMIGQTESLNASIAGGVIMYEALRQTMEH